MSSTRQSCLFVLTSAVEGIDEQHFESLDLGNKLLILFLRVTRATVLSFFVKVTAD